MDDMTKATYKGHGFTETTRVFYGGRFPGSDRVVGMIGTMRKVENSIVLIPESGDDAGREVSIGGVATRFWATAI